MNGFRRLVLAAALALAPAIALAQTPAITGNRAPVGTHAPTPPSATGAAIDVAPVNRAAPAELATTPRPTIAAPNSLAPPAPPEATGLGSKSPSLPKPKAPAGGPPRLGPSDIVAQPSPREWHLQPALSPIAREGHFMNDKVLEPVLLAVTVFVFALIGYAMIAFRRREGRVPSKLSHNTTIEIVWTVVPVLILLGIAVPSFQLLANQYDPPKADLTIKATGHQWYWEYTYPDSGGFSYDSVMLNEAESAKAGTPRLLDVDNRLVVPVGATVKVLTTAADVIHAFAVPSLWVQMDAVPGRINETWFKAEKPGLYFGQCFQLCGTKHGFMPISIEVVPRPHFLAWVAAKQAENGITPKASSEPRQAVPAPVAVSSPAPIAPSRPVAPASTSGTGTNVPRGGGATTGNQ